jgi:hypothetical protein
MGARARHLSRVLHSPFPSSTSGPRLAQASGIEPRDRPPLYDTHHRTNSPGRNAPFGPLLCGWDAHFGPFSEP